MTNLVTDIFGFALLFISIALVIWEVRSRRARESDLISLHSPTRFRRRIMMAGIIACVGVLLIAESRGLLDIKQIRHLALYIIVLSGLAFTLFVLSIRDLGDMARLAEQQAVKDLQAAIQEKSQNSQHTSGNP